MSTQFSRDLRRIDDLENKIELYRGIVEDFNTKEGSLDDLPGFYSVFLLVAGALGGYFAYDFMQESSWWWITIVVVIAFLLSVSIAMWVVKLDVRFRLGQFKKRKHKLLSKLAKSASSEVAKIGMGTLDQIAQKTRLGEMSLDQLKILMSILVKNQLVEAIKLNDKRMLYKSLEASAQANIISEVIETDE